MPEKRRGNLYLYLGLACFLAIIAVFFFDGYLGIYDTTYITSEELEQEITAERWGRKGDYPFNYGVSYGEPVYFRYEIDNRRFTKYPTSIEASLWRGGERVLTLFSEERSIGPFDEVIVEWAVDTSLLEPENHTVKIERGKVERRIILRMERETPPMPPKW